MQYSYDVPVDMSQRTCRPTCGEGRCWGVSLPLPPEFPPGGDALCAISVAQSAAILLSGPLDLPVARHSLGAVGALINGRVALINALLIAQHQRNTANACAVKQVCNSCLK